MTGAISAVLIAQQLAQQAETLARELFADAKVEGNELRWHGPGGAACSMVLRGQKQGVWCNWVDTEQKGDALELVHYTLFPDEIGRRDSCQWGARWLGLEEPDRDPQYAARLREQAVEALQRRAQQTEDNRQRRFHEARAIYFDNERSQPLPFAFEIADYLTRRGIDLAQLSRVPRVLRFCPAFAYDHNLLLPVMLAPICQPDGKISGIHMTFLQRDDIGAWRKAGVVPAKKSRGVVRGGAIPLLRGGSGKPWSKPPDGDTLLIAEGIENALAAALLVNGEPRVAACVSVGNLPALELSAHFRTIILVLDRDGENEPVRKARAAVREKWKREWRTVETMTPPEGIKDFSDYLLSDFARL